MTLIFSLQRYEEVIDAFMAGLEGAAGRDVSTIESVASFFVSRVDTEVDNRLEKLGTPEAAELRGKAAIANARLAYQLFEERFASPRWSALSARGARVQRPLWASTSTKDPAFPDTMYVVDLVAPDTVNTMPEPTIRAVADHGQLRGNTIQGTYEEAKQIFDQLEALGISYDDVVEVLENEGVQKFEASWKELLETIKTEMSKGRRDERSGDTARRFEPDRRRTSAAEEPHDDESPPRSPGSPDPPGGRALCPRALRRDRRPGHEEAAARHLRPGQPRTAAARLLTGRLRPAGLDRTRISHG